MLRLTHCDRLTFYFKLLKSLVLGEEYKGIHYIAMKKEERINTIRIVSKVKVYHKKKIIMKQVNSRDL